MRCTDSSMEQPPRPWRARGGASRRHHEGAARGVYLALLFCALPAAGVLRLRFRSCCGADATSRATQPSKQMRMGVVAPVKRVGALVRGAGAGPAPAPAPSADTVEATGM